MAATDTSIDRSGLVVPLIRTDVDYKAGDLHDVTELAAGSQSRARPVAAIRVLGPTLATAAVPELAPR